MEAGAVRKEVAVAARDMLMTSCSLLPVLLLLLCQWQPLGVVSAAGNPKAKRPPPSYSSQVCMGATGYWRPWSASAPLIAPASSMMSAAAEAPAPDERVGTPGNGGGEETWATDEKVPSLHHGVGGAMTSVIVNGGGGGLGPWGNATGAASSGEGGDGAAARGGEQRRQQQRRLSAAAAARPGFNPLARLCRNEGRGSRERILSPGQKLLAACLSSARRCRFTPEEGALVQEAAAALPGIQHLQQQRPSCLVLNRKSCPSGSGNKETSGEYLSPRLKQVYQSYQKLPPHEPAAKDLPRRKFGSCAVVGNSPALRASPNGDSIDRHDAVFRINVIGSGSLSALPSQQTSAPEQKDPKFTGRRTTFRVFSRLVADWLASGKVTIKPKPGEAWLVWHHHARFLLPGIQQRAGTKLPLLMMSPAFINWLLDVYFKIRQDLFRLGVGRFSCPRNINSGVKSIMLATQLCKRVDVFGISYTETSAKAGHFGNAKHLPTRFHAWDFDSTLLRLLHLAGSVTVCSRDKK